MAIYAAAYVLESMHEGKKKSFGCWQPTSKKCKNRGGIIIGPESPNGTQSYLRDSHVMKGKAGCHKLSVDIGKLRQVFVYVRIAVRLRLLTDQTRSRRPD